MTFSSELQNGDIYIIIYKRDKNSTFIGTFNRYIKDKCAEFINLTVHYSKNKQDRLIFQHYTDYNYYDVCKINNAKYARINMEKRALDKILKRLVNEYFEW